MQRHIQHKKNISQNDHYKNLIQNLKAKDQADFKLAIPTAEGLYFFPVKEIIRCEADRNYTQFHLTQERKIITSKTLKEYDETLSGHGFLRVHKSHLVNIKFVERYAAKGELYLTDKAVVEVARRRKEKVLEALRKVELYFFAYRSFILPNVFFFK